MERMEEDDDYASLNELERHKAQVFKIRNRAIREEQSPSVLRIIHSLPKDCHDESAKLMAGAIDKPCLT